MSWINHIHSIAKTLYPVCFVDANIGWVVVENGTILKTTIGRNTTSIESKSDEIPSTQSQKSVGKLKKYMILLEMKLQHQLINTGPQEVIKLNSMQDL